MLLAAAVVGMESKEKKQKTVKFSGHENQISSIVRVCREGGVFTDAELICEDGTIHVHRMVLGAVSQFLHTLLLDVWPQDRASVLLPGVRREVATQLVEFIYTGYMQLCEFNSWELQQLVLQLQIDPQNVVVDVVDTNNIVTKLVQTKDAESFVVQPKPKIESQTPGSHDPIIDQLINQSTLINRKSASTSRKSTSVERKTIVDAAVATVDRKSGSIDRKQNTTTEDTASVERRSVRQRSSDSYRSYSECSPPGSPVVSPQQGSPRRGTSPRAGGSVRNRSSSGRGTREQSPGGRSRTISGRGTGDPTVSSTGEFMSILRPSEKSNVIKIVSSRKRRSSNDDRPSKEPKTEVGGVGGRGRGKGGMLRTRGRARSRGLSTPRAKDKGRHDIRNVETWVCAICGQYDPVLPGGGGDTTEWIGCDCNRWFHKFCTKLKVVDDNFSCKMVQKTCLIHPV